MPVQKIELNFPFGADIPTIHCPVCGAIAQQPDEPVDQPCCEHIEFRFIDELSNFDYLSDGVLPVMKEWGIDDLADYGTGVSEEAYERFLKEFEGGTRVVMEVTSSGMGCGPVSFTVRYGFNFLPNIEE